MTGPQKEAALPAIGLSLIPISMCIRDSYLTEQNPDYQLEKADYQLAYEESIANNVQYAVFNPALGYLTQSDTYAECGSCLLSTSRRPLTSSSTAATG